jgi:hypothetical protein
MQLPSAEQPHGMQPLHSPQPATLLTAHPHTWCTNQCPPVSDPPFPPRLPPRSSLLGVTMVMDTGLSQSVCVGITNAAARSMACDDPATTAFDFAYIPALGAWKVRRGFMLPPPLLCCAVLCCAVLCCAVLCCAVLCCAVLCCAVLCCCTCSGALQVPVLVGSDSMLQGGGGRFISSCCSSPLTLPLPPFPTCRSCPRSRRACAWAP